MKNPTTDTGECGTPRGHGIHRRTNQKPCQPCLDAYNEARKKTRPTRAPVERRPSSVELIEEIRHLSSLGEGEAYILRAIGYEGRVKTVWDFMYKNGEQDLYARVFWSDTGKAPHTRSRRQLKAAA